MRIVSSMQFAVRWFFVPAVVISIVVGSLGRSKGQQPTVSEVVEKWKSREESLKTSTCTWREKYLTTAKKQILYKSKEKIRTSHSPKDTENLLEHELILGLTGKLAYSRKGAVWSMVLGKFSDRPVTIVLKDGRAKTFYEDDKEVKSDVASGFIQAKSFDFNEMSYFPVMLACRPSFCVDYEMLEMASTPKIIEGNQVLEISFKKNEAYRHVYYIDPSQDFLPVLVEVMFKEHLVWRLSMKHSSVDNHLLPTSWKAQEYRTNGPMLAALESNVSQWVLNEPIAEDKFDSEFPNRSRVTDTTNVKRPVMFEIDADGKKHYVTGGPIEPRSNLNLIVGILFVFSLVAFLVGRRVFFSSR